MYGKIGMIPDFFSRRLALLAVVLACAASITRDSQTGAAD
jgi:hypothetical protein